MITPQEAATLVDYPNPQRGEREIYDFIVAASARDIQLFIHAIKTHTVDADLWRARGGTAIAVRIAEDQSKSAEKLELDAQKKHEELVSLQHSKANQKANEPWYKKPIGILAIAVTAAILAAITKCLLGL